MARLPRSLSVRENHAVHKMWRGHNREWNLGKEEDKLQYLKYLNDDFESEKYDTGCALEALCLMSNHTHEIARIFQAIEYSKHMRRHHSRFGSYFNRKNSRSGKVAEDRPKTCLIAEDDYEMKAVFYIHANPVRAGIVGDARDYFWSTHRLYAFGKRAPWMRNIVLPAWYMRLGRTSAQRQKKYRELFAYYLKQYGTSKQPFSCELFYGPIVWTEKNRILISQWRKEHAPP